MTTAPIQDVSETALMVAMWRAHENGHPKPLYRDPFALKLARERGKQIIIDFPKTRMMMSCWMMAIRTRIIDELIAHAAENEVDTVLNLGAGLDARPYRLNLPKDLLWIEVDYPNIIELD
jgi:methyltransferase (TIGR00027 family)